jgi:hypothetical protein
MQEAADQFLPAQGHHLVAIVVTVVLVTHVHRGVVFIEAQQSTVGQGDAMAVAAQVVDDGVGAGQTAGRMGSGLSFCLVFGKRKDLTPCLL